MGVDGKSSADIFDEYFDSDINKISSFQREHIGMKPGLYLQEKKRNVNVYDLRFVAPNTEFIPISAIHTIEHLFATWLKTCDNEIREDVVSFNPGGCQTMFYLEVFNDYIDCYDKTPKSLELIASTLISCIGWCLLQTKVPGATENECGNYKSHDLVTAKEWLQKYKNVLIEQFK